MRSHFWRSAFAAVSAAALVLAAAPTASAAEPRLPDVQIISPAYDDPGPLRGPFTLTVNLDLGDSAYIDLSPMVSSGFNDVPVAPRTVTAEQCPAQCTVSFEVNPTSWESPLPPGWASLNVHWWSPLGGGGAYRGIQYVAPVETAWISAVERDETVAVRGYRPYVIDTGGSLVISGSGERTSGEVLEARVYPGVKDDPLPPPVVTGTGTWDQGVQPSVGRIRLETAGLASGSYRLLVRARNADGQYGLGTESTLAVRHQPVVEVDTAPFLLAGTAMLVGVSVNQPLPDGVTPGSVQVSIDGGPAQVLPVPFWNTLTDIEVPIRGGAQVPEAFVPAGIRSVTSQVLDSRGHPLGSPVTSQVRVVTFTEQASVPTLVVGQRSVVTFRGTAPPGMSYDSCTFFLSERVTVGGGSLCNRGASTYTQAVPWSPQTAGPGKVEFSVRTVQGVDSALRTIPVTVYADRTATLSTAASSAYGARLVATVAVRDMRSMSSPLVAVPGVSVALQRKAAGSSTWVHVGSGRTGSTGRALVGFVNTANGRLRAVVASSVPARSVVTAERAVKTFGTVAWSSLPTTSRSGAVAYATVTARPYERGASVRVQARFRAGSWLTLGSATVSSTGAARAGFRLYTRGAWEVRVMRVATTLRAPGYSTVRRVVVS